jgi:hypothetical protein
VPLRRKGPGANRRNACFAPPFGAVARVDWVTENTRQPVQTDAVAVQRPGEDKAPVYAFDGGAAGRALAKARAAAAARPARQWYRRRSGIEASYRQMHGALGRTTAQGQAHRLLLASLALVLRRVWVWLTWQLARSRGARPAAWLAGLPLRRLLDGLAAVLPRKYPEGQTIDLGQPLLSLKPLRLGKYWYASGSVPG